MFEPESETQETVVDLYIHTGNEIEDEAVEKLLERLDAEEVVKRTLLAVHIQQPVMLTLMITGEAEILELNRQYRRQNKSTDVLSFPMLEKPLVTAPAEWLWQAEENNEAVSASTTAPAFITPEEILMNIGDIAISWPTVQQQASVAGHDVTYEFLFLLSHGVLHLVGYDDQTEAGYAEMVRLQKEVLAENQKKG